MYPFQERAARRFLANGALLLAHDVGMGKTRTALESLRRLDASASPLSALIITPANLRPNFLDNAKRFTPELDIGVVTKIADFSAAAIPTVSYDFLRANIDFLASRRFDAVVCDEFHHGKNQATHNHACLSRLRARTDRFLCLTGSPLQNSVNEFWTLLDLVAGTAVSPDLDACLERMWDFRKASFWRRFYHCVIRKRPVVGPLKAIAHPREFRRLIGPWVDTEKKIANRAGIAAMGGSAALGALSATVYFAGFAFYATMSTAIAAIAGFFGLTLPFAVYAGTSTTIAVLTGPIGWVIAGCLLAVGATLFGRGNHQKTALTIVQIHCSKIDAMQAAGMPFPNDLPAMR